jgi:hypothetical protein
LCQVCKLFGSHAGCLVRFATASKPPERGYTIIFIRHTPVSYDI